MPITVLSTLPSLVDGKVPASQLPSYVDDVLEFANLTAFPGTGESGKIYVAIDTRKIYRWSGSVYIEIAPPPGSTDSVPEGSTNLYHTTARAAAAAPVQSVAGRDGAVTLSANDVGLGSVNNTSDADKPISDATQTALNGKAASSHASQHQTGGADAVQNVVVYSSPDVDGNLDVTGADIVFSDDGGYANIDNLVDSTETEGRVVLLFNRSGVSLALLHDSGNVMTASGSNMTLPDQSFAAFMYDASNQQWKML